MFGWKLFGAKPQPARELTVEEIHGKLASRSALEICLRLRGRAKFLKERAARSPYDSLVQQWGTSSALDEVAAEKILEGINYKRTQAGLAPLCAEDLDKIEKNWQQDTTKKNWLTFG